PELEELLQRMTAKKLEDRIGDAALVARELKRIHRTAFGPPADAQGDEGSRTGTFEVQTSFYDARAVRDSVAQSLIGRALQGDLPGALRDLGRLDDRSVQELGGRLLGAILSAGEADVVLRVEPDLVALGARAPIVLFYLARARETRGQLAEA